MIFWGLLFSFYFSSYALESSLSSCDKPSGQDEPLDQYSIHVVKNSSEAKDQFNKIYTSPQRLKNRIYWSKDKQRFVSPANSNEPVVPEEFINNVRDQISQALRNKFADFIYYADLGHFHILIPKNQNHWDLSDVKILNLYHSGELYQFKKNGSLFGELIDDPHWQWLYQMRNFVGVNQSQAPLTSVFADPKAFYNTVQHIDGYKEVGIAHMSANKNGCFSLTNTSPLNWRFDLSIDL